MKRRDLLALGLAFLPALAHAQSAIPQTAPSPWSLHEAVGAPDHLKLRATFRSRVESIDGQARPGLNSSDTLLDLRSTLFAEYQAGPLRIGGEIYDSRAYGGDLGTPIGTNDVNVAEVVQAYAALDLAAPFGPGSKARIQAGRMSLNLGSKRLVSSEDWRNTTNGYSGMRADIGLPKGVSATAIYVRPTTRLPEDRPSLLENDQAMDRDNGDVVLWGGIASKARIVGQVGAELTYYRLEEEDGPNRPTRDRQLDTFGGRVFREASAGQPDFEIEVFQQSGQISRSLVPNVPKQDVSAQFVHADLGYTFARPWNPRLSLRFDYVSGDRDGGDYGRFDTMYGMRGAELAPSGLYNTVGRANLISPGLFLGLTPTLRDDLVLQYRPLWLASRTDSFSTSNVRDPSGTSGNFAGNQLEVRWRRWLVPDALRFELNGIYLAKGRFLRNAPNSPRTPDTAFGAVNLTAYF